MTRSPALWDDVARLIEYPDDLSYEARVAAVVGRLRAAGEDAAHPLARFREAIAGIPLATLQERYAEAFDFDTASALEMGWHLYGDDPNRGPWLAGLAEALDARAVPSTDELPDHLARLLMLVAREDDERAGELAALIAPAVRLVVERLAARANPFTHLVQAAGALLDARLHTVRVGRD